MFQGSEVTPKQLFQDSLCSLKSFGMLQNLQHEFDPPPFWTISKTTALSFAQTFSDYEVATYNAERVDMARWIIVKQFAMRYQYVHNVAIFSSLVTSG